MGINMGHGHGEMASRLQPCESANCTSSAALRAAHRAPFQQAMRRRRRSRALAAVARACTTSGQGALLEGVAPGIAMASSLHHGLSLRIAPQGLRTHAHKPAS